MTLMDDRLPAIVPSLLLNRSASLGAGNRRTLFAKFDELLAAPELQGLDEPRAAGDSITDRGPVRLSRIRLRNWRSFERAELRLGDADPARPLFIVGGQNGFGKSSILEAFAFGLFGRRALVDLAPLIGVTTGRNSLRRSYAAVMERVLHRAERSRREGACAVRLDFDTADGPIEVERKWYFDESGSLIEADEELFVHVGWNRELLRAPDGAEPFGWLQEQVEHRIMPAGLAPFFVFDGEQIERWADRRLSDQVRTAIERVLGLDDVVALADDLRAYAKDRERGAAAGDPDELVKLHDRIGRLRNTIASADERLVAVKEEVERERGLREAALIALAVTANGTHADLQASLEHSHALEVEKARLRRELAAVLAEFGPFAVMGSALTSRVADEVEREGQIASTAELGRAGLEEVWHRFAALHPPLDRSVAKAMRSRLERAWAGDGAAPAGAPVHVHLAGTEHRMVANRLRSAGADAVGRVGALRTELEQVSGEVTKLEMARLDEQRRQAGREDAQRELVEIAARLERAEEQRRGIERELSLLEASLEPELRELREVEGRLATLAPKTKGASAARHLADELERWIAAQAASKYDRFAEAVSECFRRLSHKDQIARVSIKRDGSVALFDANGHDVTDYRLSAGESQLFALSLIAAVGAVAKRELPLVVDTPLSRLDSQHRAGVMKMLMERGGQTILLTQPEEIGHRHLSALAPATAGVVRITHRLQLGSGVGVSDFADGYVEEVAA
ncbi:DNA sulfur modification protein DndD [Sphingomonas sp. SORGH_AS 879]|nr:DNA sulfur modification protein DndD [Sphingomonas sp. SORGH_AS_0879]